MKRWRSKPKRLARNPDSAQLGPQAGAGARRRRMTAPMPPKPMIISAQLAGSGTTPTVMGPTPPRRICLTSSKVPFVVKLNLSMTWPSMARALKNPFGRISRVCPKFPVILGPRKGSSLAGP